MVDGKGELMLQMNIRFLISWNWDVEVVLDFLGMPNIITKILISERGDRGVSVRVIQCKKNPKSQLAIVGFEVEKRSLAKECSSL